MYRIEFSPLAKDDLIRFSRYLEDEFDSEIASAKIKKMIEHIRRFEKYPLLGRPLTNTIDIPTDYMYFVAEKNYIFYRLEKYTVYIIRVLDTRQDYINILFGDRKNRI
ncbi:type II toxin-antitoxin system RelE/ParE family toxin [Fusibacter sp. 3D3]|uniref:type II toxin-antitoxin system RelE/ParE family toxin n=1 Tax=Fusibacter sp. 3D3 TaxID=1048380 RepID=UPI000852B568|nr:type II toxin-antitoxin system RelE/ParE family toxin [Fusibacter sp. 3D3]